MKKNKFLILLIQIFVIIQLFIPFFNPTKTSAKLTTFVYARVEQSNVYLYKSTNPLPQNAYFEVPESYFVLLLSNFNQIFYKAQYRDVVGYILKDEVSPVSEIPITPYLTDISFYAFTTDGTSIMNSPFNDFQSTLTTIEKYENVDYYGQIIGYEKTQGRGNIWYYGKTKQGVSGYMYSGLCEINQIIPTNTETVTKLDNPFGDNNDDYLYNLVDQSTGLKILLITLITLPSIFLLWLIFRPIKTPIKENQIKVTKSERKNKTIKQIQEFNDEEL